MRKTSADGYENSGSAGPALMSGGATCSGGGSASRKLSTSATTTWPDGVKTGSVGHTPLTLSLWLPRSFTST